MTPCGVTPMKFIHFIWTGAALGIIQVGLLWLMIDYYRLPTLLAGAVAALGLAVTRYNLLKVLNVISRN
jgi:hypothetical protein